MSKETSNAVAVLSTSSADLVSELSGLTHSEKLAKLAQVTKYTGADTKKIDSYLNKTLQMTGAVLQKNAQIRVDEDKQKPDPQTGLMIEFETVDRVIFKAIDPENDKATITIAFASMSATNFFENFIFPFFGQGDYAEPIPVKFTQTPTRSGGRAYNGSIVG
jgi:hypothetical protein